MCGEHSLARMENKRNGWSYRNFRELENRANELYGGRNLCTRRRGRIEWNKVFSRILARTQNEIYFQGAIALPEIYTISIPNRKSIILILPLVVTPRIAITKKFIQIPSLHLSSSQAQLEKARRCEGMCDGKTVYVFPQFL